MSPNVHFEFMWSLDDVIEAVKDHSDDKAWGCFADGRRRMHEKLFRPPRKPAIVHLSACWLSAGS